MKASEHLRAARALIDTPEKWTKGPSQYDGRLCMLGASGAVDGRLHRPHVHSRYPYDYLLAALPIRGEVSTFNDDPATTHADAMRVYDKAIAAAEADEER